MSPEILFRITSGGHGLSADNNHFIESILIKLPVPFLIAGDVADGPRKGCLEIIDGSQRIRTLDNFFLLGRLKLEGLTRLTSAIVACVFPI